MEPSEERRYGGLSPFELKDKLVALAKHRSERMWLNAGRGNPNWVALEPRAAFFRLGDFALTESSRVALAPGLGGLPHKRGVFARLQTYLSERPDAPGGALLLDGIAYARDRHGFHPDLLVGEWVDGVLGDHYPVPPRMLTHAEALVRAHLVIELFRGDAVAGRFDLFAVEGVSAGIAYVFQSLVSSRLLARGDRIAVGVPIFTPYLDVPRLPEYGFEIVKIVQDEGALWRYPRAEIDKLRDPRIPRRQSVESHGRGARRSGARTDRRDRTRTARLDRDHRRRLCAVHPGVSLARRHCAEQFHRSLLVLQVLGRHGP